MSTDKTLSQEVAQLANDLATKSPFSLGGDIKVAADVVKRIVAALDKLDKRITVLEANAAKNTGIAGGTRTTGEIDPRLTTTPKGK